MEDLDRLQESEDREALGDNVRIVFHDKKGRVTLIDPDKADDWKNQVKKT